MAIRRIKQISRTLKKQQIASKATTSKIYECIPEMLNDLRGIDNKKGIMNLQTIKITIQVTYPYGK